MAIGHDLLQSRLPHPIPAPARYANPKYRDYGNKDNASDNLQKEHVAQTRTIDSAARFNRMNNAFAVIVAVAKVFSVPARGVIAKVVDIVFGSKIILLM